MADVTIYHRIVTNADKIRAMTDEELSKLMGDNSVCPPDCTATEIYCDTQYGVLGCYYGCWQNWLKQEVECDA